MAGKLVLIMGPSGVGKSVILKELRRRLPALHFPCSATTRTRRPGEGSELYRFVNDAEFDALLQSGAILEHAVVHGGARYGTLKGEIIPFIDQGKTVVREVDVQGFDSIRNDPLFMGPGAPYTLQTIFILPESKEQLIRHIQKRAPMSPEELERRIASMEKELEYATHCDAAVRNPEGRLEETYRAVEQLILNP